MTNLNTKSHDEAVRIALITLDVNPYYVMRRYIEAALEEEDGNLSATARRLQMHRRTLQRIIDKERPMIRRAPRHAP